MSESTIKPHQVVVTVAGKVVHPVTDHTVLAYVDGKGRRTLLRFHGPVFDELAIDRAEDLRPFMDPRRDATDGEGLWLWEGCVRLHGGEPRFAAGEWRRAAAHEAGPWIEQASHAAHDARFVEVTVGGVAASGPACGTGIAVVRVPQTAEITGTVIGEVIAAESRLAAADLPHGPVAIGILAWIADARGISLARAVDVMVALHGGDFSTASDFGMRIEKDGFGYRAGWLDDDRRFFGNDVVNMVLALGLCMMREDWATPGRYLSL